MEKRKVLFEDCILRNRELWFFARYFNGLLKMNIETGEVSVVSSISKYEWEAERLVVKIIEYQEKIFCIPMNADELWIYYINGGTWENIPIEQDDYGTIMGKFFQACIYEDKIYMIPSLYDKIAIFHLKSNEIEYIDFIDDTAKSMRKINKDCYFRSSYAIVDGFLYLASCNDNRVLKYNLLNNEIVWITLDGNVPRFVGIIYDGKNFWIAPRKYGNVITWDGVSRCDEVVIPQLQDAYYQGIIDTGNGIVISGQSACGNIIIYHDKSIETSSDHYLLNTLVDGEIRVLLKHDGSIKILDKSKVIFEGKSEISEQQLSLLMKNSSLYKESDKLTLNMFIQSILQ